MLTGGALALIYPPAMKFIGTWSKTGCDLGGLTLPQYVEHLYLVRPEKRLSD